MSEEPIVFNGRHARTGRSLLPPLTALEIGRIALCLPIEPDLEERLQTFAEGIRAHDPLRALSLEMKDPTDLSQTGWGVIFAPGVTSEMEEALSPLFERRRQQAGQEHFRALRGPVPTASELLKVTDVQKGAPPDPKKLPYYLLLVGDPTWLPFQLQTELDVQYAVGRLWFENANDYRSYAEAVVAYEVAAEVRGKERAGRLLVDSKNTEGDDGDLTFFAVENPGDRATYQTANDLIAYLHKALKLCRPRWRVRTIGGGEAKRARLTRLLGAEKPSILFTASHGVGYDADDRQQGNRQGSLICDDWPGEPAPLEDEHCFAGADVPTEADLSGLIAFLFACYGAGTPSYDSFGFRVPDGPRKIAPAPFVARLPQRLLAAGALAVVGHVDRAWTTSFTWNGRGGHVVVYDHLLRQLMDGYPIGFAMEQMGLRFADLAAALQVLWSDRAFLRDRDVETFGELWLAASDARNFVVLGDPAVRLGLGK
ncbi:MAG TPA: hypothetical protein VN851_13725 [Thermoanaerobaculia bacterium]|nr:hypothetical protein [Thermoanaerobaculia bacterium]